jgi:hypothetical protein
VLSDSAVQGGIRRHRPNVASRLLVKRSNAGRLPIGRQTTRAAIPSGEENAKHPIRTIHDAGGNRGGKGTCTTDIPIQLEIQTTYIDGTTTNAIQGDGSPYVNGTGVVASVHLCDGTGDAIIALSTTRATSVSFAKLLAATADTPGWALSGSTINCQNYNICWTFNIDNIWFVPPGLNLTHSDEYEFTTHLGGGGPLFSKVSMLNPSAEVPLPQDQSTAVADAPYPNSPVRVHHCPASFQGPSAFCSSGQHEQWFVWPDSAATRGGTSQNGLPITQVATLILNGMTGKGGKGPLNGGEFSIPFYFKISALQ